MKTLVMAFALFGAVGCLRSRLAEIIRPNQQRPTQQQPAAMVAIAGYRPDLVTKLLARAARRAVSSEPIREKSYGHLAA
jgi:hypothetical protein